MTGDKIDFFVFVPFMIFVCLPTLKISELLIPYDQLLEFMRLGIKLVIIGVLAILAQALGALLL